MLTTLAVVSGLLQALGYTVYVWKSLRKEVDPNPTTWLMFAYGTAALTILEWDRQAHWQVLILPIVCAVLSVGVAALCAFRGKLRWPDDNVSKAAFLTDVVLTVGYITVKVSASTAVLTQEEQAALVLLFLILSNMSTIISFVPLLKDAWEDPSREHPLPWTIWTIAYATLGLVTYLNGESPELLIYPVSCAMMHGLVALFALRTASSCHPRCALD